MNVKAFAWEEFDNACKYVKVAPELKPRVVAAVKDLQSSAGVPSPLLKQVG
jgi:hypothetical protein